MVATEQKLLFVEILLRLVVILLVTIGTLHISRLILKRWLWPVTKKTKNSEKIFRLVENVLLNLILLQGTLAAVRILSEYFGLYTGLIDNFFFLLYCIIVTYIVLSLISIASESYLSRVHLCELEEIDLKEIDHRATRSIQYISQLVFSVLVIIILLQHFGITEASFNQSLTALGIGGIIIGLAAQNTLADIIAGIAISIDRPFRIRDRILIEQLDTWGDVIEITWRSTRILTRDNRQVAIPNSVISKELITNYSMPDRNFRVETFVVVSYGPAIDYVRNLILESLANENWIMHNKPIQALVSEYTEQGVKFKVRCWIENYVDTRISEDQLNTAIYKALINANVSLSTSTSYVTIHFDDVKNDQQLSDWSRIQRTDDGISME